ncbi:MAG TPA: carboxypeptidase-like regulatory domain-containing protein [Puia sp.]|nr:carboxypeptidase-like regulatory domain-containing protein [Puia sp.]
MIPRYPIDPFLPYALIRARWRSQHKAGHSGPAGPAGAAGMNHDTGTITGTAYLYNEFSFKLASQSGITVTLISGTTQLTAMTNDSGQYLFHGIPTGTYNLTYAFAAFGTVNRYGISHFGGGAIPTEVPEVDLVQIPVKTAIDSMSVVELYGAYIEVTIKLDTSSLQYVQYYQNFLLLVGKSNAVGPTNYVKSYSQIFTPDGLGNYTMVFQQSDVASFFNPGDTMYITASTYNRYIHPNSSPIWNIDDVANESYVDPLTGYVIFPNARFSPTWEAVYSY